MDWEALRGTWSAADIPCAATLRADNLTDAVRAQETIGGTVWVRGVEDALVGVCAVVENPADLALRGCMSRRQCRGRSFGLRDFESAVTFMRWRFCVRRWPQACTGW